MDQNNYIFHILLIYRYYFAERKKYMQSKQYFRYLTDLPLLLCRKKKKKKKNNNNNM